MNKNRKTLIKQCVSFFYSSTRIKQAIAFVANTNIQTKVMVLIQIHFYLFSKVEHINHNTLKPRISQAKDNMFQQRFAPHSNQSLRHGVSKWFKACS